MKGLKDSTVVSHLRVPPCRVFALVWLAMLLCDVSWAAESSAATLGAGQGTIYQNSKDVPQWQNVGLEDLLVVSSQPSVPTARPMRQVYALGEDVGQKALVRIPYVAAHVVWTVMSRSVPGCYIYFLLNLRL